MWLSRFHSSVDRMCFRGPFHPIRYNWKCAIICNTEPNKCSERKNHVKNASRRHIVSRDCRGRHSAIKRSAGECERHGENVVCVSYCLASWSIVTSAASAAMKIDFQKVRKLDMDGSDSESKKHNFRILCQHKFSYLQQFAWIAAIISLMDFCWNRMKLFSSAPRHIYLSLNSGVDYIL